jgi:hypothetical protein
LNMAGSIGFKGTLDTLPLHSVLYAISSNGQSGKLKLEAGDDVVTLRIRAGAVTSVRTSDVSLRIGQLLIDQGFVTEEQIEQALALQSVAHDPDRIGEVLTDIGFVTPDQIRLTIAAQLEAALFRILIQENGSFTFEPSDGSEPEPVVPGLYVEPIVLNAMYLADEWLARNEPKDVRTLPDRLIDPDVLEDVPEPEHEYLVQLLHEYDQLHSLVWETGTTAAQVKETIEQIYERAMVRLAFLSDEDEAVTGRAGSRNEVIWLADEFIDPWVLSHLTSDANRVLLDILNGNTNMLELAKSVNLPPDSLARAIDELVEQELITIKSADLRQPFPDETSGLPNHQFELVDIEITIEDLNSYTRLGRQLLVELLNGYSALDTLVRRTGISGGAIMSTMDRLVDAQLVRIVEAEESVYSIDTEEQLNGTLQG